MQIAISKTREQFPLSKRKIWKKTVATTIGWAVALLAIYGFLLLYGFLPSANLVYPSDSDYQLVQSVKLYFDTLAILILGLICIIFILAYFYQSWYFAVYFYDLTDDLVIIRKGPISPLEITIPYERIQDVYVSQDILDRIFGIYDVHLASASLGSGVEAHIHGVEKVATDGLRAMLLKKVQERISKKQDS